MQSPQIIPSGKACGAEVTGVDLSEAGALTLAALQQALLAHHVVVVRDQRLTPEALQALGSAFGPLEAQGVSVLGTRDPALRDAHLVVSSRMPLERPTGSLGGGAAFWQSDLSYRARPCSIAILHAVAVPPGARMVFSNQQAAWDALPADLRAKVENRMLLHDESRDGEGRLRPGHAEVSDPREATGAQHRIARSHPDTRRKALYLGRRRNAWIIGLPLEESETLLDRLWAHATQPQFSWTHDWQAGDTLLWDNRCLLYRHEGGADGAPRDMLRAQVRGEIPR